MILWLLPDILNHMLQMVYAQLFQSCPTLCDPMDYSPPGSSVHGIFQARILKSVTISFSRGSSQPLDQTGVSWVPHMGRWNFYHSVVSDSLWPHGLQPARLLCPWDSSGKNTGVGCHVLLQWVFSDPGIEPGSPALQAGSLSSKPPGKYLLGNGIVKFRSRTICLKHSVFSPFATSRSRVRD